MILPDVNIWLAFVWAGGKFHPPVKKRLDDIDEDLALCRVVQMGLLRALSNPAVMGEDVISRRDSWAVVDQLRVDSRVVWLEEPAQFEPIWRVMSARDDKSHKLWTDDYLAAFAQAADMTLVTLDGKFARRYPSVRVETWLPDSG